MYCERDTQTYLKAPGFLNTTLAMPRRKWIDKNQAATFQLVHRSQNDPLIHDESAQDRILYQVSGPSGGGNGLHLADLEDDLDFETMRDNEGEAANYGIYFDDTSYDYMQHLRDFGEGSGESHFIDAAPVRVQGKGKGKIMKLEDAIREASLAEDDVKSISGTQSIFDDNASYMSAARRPKTYQDQQNVPDAIAGFQPDMDPRLREVLEALDDEAYVDDQDGEDIFGELTKHGKDNELDIQDFELTLDDEDDDGWESDVTEKPAPSKTELNDMHNLPKLESLDLDDNGLPEPQAEPAAAQDGDWMKEFAKYKEAAKAHKAQNPAVTPSELQAPSEARAPSTLYTLGGTPLRKKKRKGALTNPSAYSMTSSALARTDGQRLLDDRFDKVEKMYRLDEDDEYLDDDEDGGMSLASGMTGKTGMTNMSKMSKMSTISTRSFADGPAREDLDTMMDGFLAGWNQGNPIPEKRKGKKGRKGGIGRGDDDVGIATLDRIRKELGPAIVPKAYRS